MPDSRCQHHQLACQESSLRLVRPPDRVEFAQAEGTAPGGYYVERADGTASFLCRDHFQLVLRITVSLLCDSSNHARRQRRADMNRHTITKFRSLFSWITHVGCLVPQAGWIRVGFRSLFSWITHVGCWSASGRTSAPSCFDPCSPGSRSSARRGRGRPRRRSMFRSLFSWITLFGIAGRGASGFPTKSFDPCSPGSRSSAWNREPNPTAGYGFRSLFSWITLFGYLQKAIMWATSGVIHNLW